MIEEIEDTYYSIYLTAACFAISTVSFGLGFAVCWMIFI